MRVCGRNSWNGLWRLWPEVALAYWNRHSLSGSGQLCRSLWNIVRLVISRRHLSAGQPSCRKSSSFGVNQSAWRRLRATLACIRSKDIASPSRESRATQDWHIPAQDEHSTHKVLMPLGEELRSRTIRRSRPAPSDVAAIMHCVCLTIWGPQITQLQNVDDCLLL